MSVKIVYGITSNIAYFHVKRLANASNRARSCSYIRPNSGSIQIYIALNERYFNQALMRFMKLEYYLSKRIG